MSDREEVGPGRENDDSPPREVDAGNDEISGTERDVSDRIEFAGPSTSSGNRTGQQLPNWDTVDEMIDLLLLPRIDALNSNANSSFQPTTKMVELKCEPETGVFAYHVEFNPDVKNVRFRKLLMGELKQREIVEKATLFSGSILFAPKKLPTEVVEATVAHPELPGQMTTCTLTFLGERNIQERVAAYSAVFRLLLEVFSSGQLVELILQPQIPRGRLDIWAGLSVKCVLQDGKFFLRIDSSNEMLRKETAYDIYSIWKASELPNWRTIFAESVLGQYVDLDYQTDKGRCKVCAVFWGYNPTYKFQRGSNLMCHRPGFENFCHNYNNHISLEEYFKEKYNLEIQNVDQPLLAARVPSQNSNPSDKEFLLLVPKFCTMSTLLSSNPFHPLGISTNRQIQWDMREYTRMDVAQRQELTEWWFKHLIESELAVQFLKDWGLSTVNTDSG